MTLAESMELDLNELFFDVDEFGTTVTYVSSNGVEKDIVVALFDDEDEFIEGTLVSIWAKTSDIPNISKDDIVIYQGEPMDVQDFRVDEQGLITKLFINRKREV